MPFQLKCTTAPCLLCSMNEPDPSSRSFKIAACFKALHLRDAAADDDDEDLLITLIGLWNIALAQPDDPQFPMLGIFECMAKLIHKCLKQKRQWLFHAKNVSIPYYAAHIIGSYTMNKARHAKMAVESGVISPLMELMRGKLSWVEQRVAVRALGHIASHKKTFISAIAVHEEEIVKLTMKISSTCFETVYIEFVSLESEKRLEYQRELMTRGPRSSDDSENKKAEEWASQLQCWSLYLLNCFAIKNMSIHLMCNEKFLKELCGMWGGLENYQNSFSGVGLIRSLCKIESSRKIIASLKEVVLSLCKFSRCFDNWQLTAIDSLMLLLKDVNTRCEVINVVAPFLVDLVELRMRINNGGKRNIGDMITQVLLQDYSKIKYGKLVMECEKSHKALEEIWDLKVERRKNMKIMSEQELRQTRLKVRMLKQEANKNFWAGEVEEAIEKYTTGLDLCPVKLIKERIVLYSNRAQCYLMLQEPDLAICDSTRALCLSGVVNPHVKSLWRRSQAYDMKGMGRESLIDCLMFINGRLRLKDRRRKRDVKIPFYAMRMLNKQMNATWLFKNAAAAATKSKAEGDDDDHVDEEMMLRKMKELIPGTPTTGKMEPKLNKVYSWRKRLQSLNKRTKN